MTDKAPAISTAVVLSIILIASGLVGAFTRNPTFTAPRRKLAASEVDAYMKESARRRRKFGLGMAAFGALAGALSVLMIALL